MSLLTRWMHLPLYEALGGLSHLRRTARFRRITKLRCESEKRRSRQSPQNQHLVAFTIVAPSLECLLAARVDFHK